MSKGLQRILSILCILTMVMGCWAVTASAEEQPNRIITVDWADEDNYEGLRPGSIQASIGGQTVTLSSSNSWAATAYAEEGAQWVLPEVPGYVCSYSGTEITTVTYRHPVSRTQLSASVTWDDNGNAAGLRPASVRLRLLADGKPYGASVAASNSNGWSVSWQDLPVNRKGGTTPVVYSIEQADTLDAYTTTVSGAKIVNTLKTGGLSLAAVLDNIPEGADVSGMTVTVSGPDPKMPVTLTVEQAAGGYSFGSVIPGAYMIKLSGGDNLAEGYEMDPGHTKLADAVTVTAGESASLAVGYGWRKPTGEEPDEDPTANLGALIIEIQGPDPRMPMTITYDQFVDGRFEIDNLVPGIYVIIERNAEGLIRAYTLTNDSITAVTLNVEGEGATAVLVNRYTPEPTPEPDDEVIDIPVNKVWDDNGNQDGNRPASITVTLFADGVRNETVTLSDANGWAHVFTGKPRFNEDGTEIIYTVNEDPVPLYNTSIQGTTIVNTYTPETTTTTVTKIWNDNGNERHIRPTSLAVTLEPLGTVYVLSEENGWTMTVTNLPTRTNGQTVNYYWTEQRTVNYVQANVKKDGNATTFTNQVVQLPRVPEEQAQPKIPLDTWYVFEDYETALGVNVIINHVGDCFD